MWKNILKIFMWFIIVILVFGFSFLVFFTITDYRPKLRELIPTSEKSDTIPVDKPLRILTWNIGYAGLDKNMDFFYDGGTKVRPSEKQVEKSMDGIAGFLSDHKETDFILLQEIDEEAKRSYYKNQVEYFENVLYNHHSSYAVNYNVQFIPKPLTDPMGKVKAGLVTFSTFSPVISERYTFPFNFGWPLRVFMLDRCFLSMRFPTTNKKELVLINTHNSAFDHDGELRKAELNYFRKFLLDEYKKGNYVVVGGDFNQCPLNVHPEFDEHPFDFADYHVIPDTLLPSDWKYVYDNSVPSNRRVDIPYKKGETKVTLIDFFILSPNVEIDSVKCEDLDFEYSDHNPVIAVFKLINQVNQ